MTRRRTAGRQKRAPRTKTPTPKRRGASRPEPRHSRAPALAILVVVGLIAIGIGLGMRALRENAPKAVATGPNIVVIVLDDLDTYTWDKLPALSSLLGGRDFTNAFTANGSGSASRMEMLTGQYAHNNGVLSDKAPIGGFARSVRNGSEKLTVAVALQRAGYKTGLVGEYLDGYGVSSADTDAGVQATYVPPGWDSWYAISGDPAYTGFTINADGTVAQPGGYLTSDLASRSVAFLTDGDPAPHFLWLAPLSVRLPSEPATQYADTKVDTTLPAGEKDVTDKPAFLSSLKPDDPKQVGAQQAGRLRTLLSIVDLVRQVRTAAGPDAVIILTSDGGFHLGQNSLPVGNGTAYDPDIRVPLVIAGAGQKLGPDTRLAAGLDLAPTIAALAGTDLPAQADGASLLTAPATPRDALLIEHEAAGLLPVYNAIRTADGWLYVEWDDGTLELYNVRADAKEETNLAVDPDVQTKYGERMARLASELHDLMTCAGSTCP